MRYSLSDKVLGSDFVKEVVKRSKQNMLNCYQCGKCSAGCPINFKMDYQPSEIMRMVQLGMKKAVLQSETIWFCISCQTCTTRCPRENDPARVMDVLRSIYCEEYANGQTRPQPFFKRLWSGGLKEAISMGPKSNVRLFNSVFLENIRRHGRNFDASLIGGFNAGTGYLLRNLLKAPLMFFKGKLNLIPKRIKGVERVREISRKIEETGSTRL